MKLLFKGDYERLGCLPDYSSSNRSFLKLSDVLSQSNIENSLLPLSIINRDILNLDPHSPNLTDEEKSLILMECKDNFWYFLREVVRVPSKGSYIYDNFNITAPSYTLAWLLLNNVDTFCVGPRDSGIDDIVDVIIIYMNLMYRKENLISLLNMDEDNTRVNIGNIVRISSLLPEFMRFSTVPYLNINNAPKSNKDIDLVARNISSSPTMIIKNTAFIDHIADILILAVPGSNIVKRLVRDQGAIAFTLVMTSASQLNNESANFVREYLNLLPEFSKAFFDEPDRESLTELLYSNKGMEKSISFTFSYRDMGFSKEKIHDIIESSCITDPGILDSEFFNSWG